MQLDQQPRATTGSVRQLVIGLVCVLIVVGTVFTIQSIRRMAWEGRCVEAGGQVLRQTGEMEPYLAPGSTRRS
ncbi:MAG TPA: hypothetical protein VIT41_04540 [Microlunatus sp.]